MGSSTCDFAVKADVIKDSAVDYNSDEEKNIDCTCKAASALRPEDDEDSADEEYRRPRRAGRRPPTPRLYSPSPAPYHLPPPPPPPPPPLPPVSFGVPYISSSAQLLDRVGKEDGIVGLPHPAPKREVYLATYPFGERDVKKWSWLFSAGIGDEFITSGMRSLDEDLPRCRISRFGFALEGEIPSVYISRALDVNVVPEDTKHNVRYFIITQNPVRSAGYKLVVAESREAAAMLIYSQMVRGDWVVFVGAMVHGCQTGPTKKFKRASSVEEAVSCYRKGFVGVIC